MDPTAADKLFTILREFMAKHQADETEWDAIDTLQATHQAQPQP